MKYVYPCLLLLLAIFLCCSIVEAKGWKQKDFIVTMWCSPPATDENTQILARDGYNLTNALFVSGDDTITLLDLAQKNGIKSLFHDVLFKPDTLDDPDEKAKIDAVIDKVKNYPALEGYYLRDEPSAAAFPDLARLVKYLKERDPNHYAYINLYPTYADQQSLGVFSEGEPVKPIELPKNYEGADTSRQAIICYNEYLRLFIEQIKPEIISYDHYLFFKDANGPIDGAGYFMNLELVRRASIKAKLPFMNIVQACTIDPPWRLPTENELRWLAYSTMAYGAKGISWFLYWGPKSYGGLYQDGNRMPIADQVARINQDIKALGPELMKLTSTTVYNTAPLPIATLDVSNGSPVKATGGKFVIGMFEQHGVENTFMVMNRDYTANSTAKLTLKLGSGKLMEFSVDKHKWVDIKKVQDGSSIDVDLIPGGGKLFKVVE